MTTAPQLHDDSHLEAASAALRRIEGQCRGLQRMLEERRPCAEILQQITAARNSLDAVGYEIIVCAIETELDDGSLAEATRGRLRGALAHVRKLR